MKHQEIIRYIPGSRCAVLMIHGIVGTPNHFRQLVPLVPQDWSLYNILLDGHGKTVEDFGATSMAKWKQQVNTWLETLFCRHEKILIVAHSMGTLFAIQAAIDHPDKISKLFLLSVPTRPHYPPSTAISSFRLSQCARRPDDKATQEMLEVVGVIPDRNVFKYFTWIPNFWSLLKECRRIRKQLHQLKVSTQTFQSRKDELVSFRSVKDLQDHPYIVNTVLEHSGHSVYREPDLSLLQKTLTETIQSI